MPGLLRGVVRTAAIAGTATAVSNRVSRRQAGRWARQDAQRAAAYAPAEPAYAAPPQPAYGAPVESAGGSAERVQDDQLAQLERLADLKERGVLSEAEFAEQKRRILGF
jgi:hypothetical protein